MQIDPARAYPWAVRSLRRARGEELESVAMRFRDQYKSVDSVLRRMAATEANDRREILLAAID